MKTIITLGKLMTGIASSLLLITIALGQSSGSPQPKPETKQTVRQLEISNKPWTGDFDQYYVAYKLQLEAREAAAKAREQVSPGTSKPR